MKTNYTNGDEYTLDGEDYYGFYCFSSAGDPYTGTEFIFGVSKKLVKKPNINEDENVKKYNLITNKESTIIEELKFYYPIIKEKDYDQGYIIRYFCCYSNDKNSRVVEVSRETFNALYNNILYLCIQLKWSITGIRDDRFSDSGVLLEMGVISKNKKEVNDASIYMPNIKYILKDYDQFFKE